MHTFLEFYGLIAFVNFFYCAVVLLLPDCPIWNSGSSNFIKGLCIFAVAIIGAVAWPFFWVCWTYNYLSDTSK